MTEHHDLAPETATSASTAAETTTPEQPPAETKPAPVARKKKRWITWTPRNVFLLVALLVLLSGAINKAARPVDDAFITYRYAANLLAGRGLVFNPNGPRVEGYTSFGQILLSLPFVALDDNGQTANARNQNYLGVAAKGTILLAVVAWALAVALLWKFMRGLRPGELDRPEWFVLLYLGLCHPAVIWVWSGMETAILALAWVAAWYFHLREREDNTLPVASALCTVAAGLLHPEGILIGAVLGLSWFIPLDKKRVKNGLLYAALVAVLFGGYWLWRWSYFGELMPNTFYAKVGVGGGLAVTGLRYVWIAAVANILPLVLLYLIIRQWHEIKTWPRWLVLALASIGVLLAYNIAVGGDYFSFQRFLLPIFPFLLLATWDLWYRRRAAKALEDAQEQERAQAEAAAAPAGVAPAATYEEPAPAEPLRRHPLLVAVLVLIPLLIWSLLIKGQIIQHLLLERIVPEFADVGRAMARQLPKNATIATIPIGAFGYYSGHPILDITGLTDKHTAHLAMPTGLRNVGHEKFDYNYVFTQLPELIIQLPILLPNSDTGLQLWMIQTSINPIQYRMYDHEKLAQDYVLAWLSVKKKTLPVLKNKKLVTALVPLGVYGYLRRDLAGQPGYEKWQVLPEATRQRVLTGLPKMARLNPFRKMSLGTWRFQGGEETPAGGQPLSLFPAAPAPAPTPAAPANPFPIAPSPVAAPPPH